MKNLFLFFTGLLLSTSLVFGQAEIVATDAVDILFSPAGSVSATDVQNAIEELDSEKISVETQTLDDVVTLGNSTGLSITAGTFVKSGGTSSEFLKADGSIDNSTYLTGNQTITLSGDVSGSGTTSIDVTLDSDAVNSLSGFTADTVNSDVTLYSDYSVYNVGIGTDDPDYKLHVSGDIYTDSSLYVDDYIYGNTTTGRLAFVANTEGSTAADMVIDANGNVGIGTSSPSSKLDVEGDSLVEFDLNATVAGIGGCDSNTGFLSHLDGSDGATSATDENCNASGAKTITFVSTGQLDTAQKKFGTASFVGDGNSDYFTISDSNDFTIGDGNFTIDFWVRFNTVQTTAFFSHLTNDSTFEMAQYTSGVLQFYSVRSGVDTNIRGTWTPSVDTWYHVALVRSAANTYNWYVDGNALSLATNDTDISNHTNLSSVVYVGHRQDNSSTAYIDGWIDEWRFSNSARWTTNFTPPTAPYDAESTTTSPKIALQGSGTDLWTIKNDGENSDRFEILEDDTDVRLSIEAGGNVGIATTAPGAKLDVNGVANFRNALQVGDAGDVLFVDDSTGNVGIGTTEPGAILSISKGASAVLTEMVRFNRAVDGNRYNSINSYSDEAGNARIDFLVHDGVTATSQADVMVLKGNGNVGIGTTNPVGKLQVDGTTGAQAYLVRQDATTLADELLGRIVFDSTDDAVSSVDGSAVIAGFAGANHAAAQKTGYLTFSTKGDAVVESAAATERMRITSGGNVGIGTTSPASKLDIAGTSPVLRISDTTTSISSGGTYGDIEFYSSDTTQQGTIARIRAKGVDGNLGGDSDLAFWTFTGGGSLSEKMRIRSNGNVGIGTTSPASKLDVNGTGTETIFTVGRDARTNGYLDLGFSGQLANFNSLTGYTFSRQGVEKMVIDNSGNVGIGTTSPSALLNIKAGTASVAPLKLTSGTNLTTPENGAIEYDGSSLDFTIAGVRRSLSQGDDTRVSDITVANTTTETTVHTSPVIADEFQVGKMYKLTVLGKYSTANASDTFTLRAKIGGTTLLTTLLSAGNATDAALQSVWYLTIRTLGATGTYSAYVHTVLHNNVVSTTPVSGTVDTTSAEDLTLTLQWSAADAGNTATIMQSVLEVIN